MLKMACRSHFACNESGEISEAWRVHGGDETAQLHVDRWPFGLLLSYVCDGLSFKQI